MGLISNYVLYKMGKKKARKEFEEYLEDLFLTIKEADPTLSDEQVRSIINKLYEDSEFL